MQYFEIISSIRKKFLSKHSQTPFRFLYLSPSRRWICRLRLDLSYFSSCRNGENSNSCSRHFPSVLGHKIVENSVVVPNLIAARNAENLTVDWIAASSTYRKNFSGCRWLREVILPVEWSSSRGHDILGVLFPLCSEKKFMQSLIQREIIIEKASLLWEYNVSQWIGWSSVWRQSLRWLVGWCENKQCSLQSKELEGNSGRLAGTFYIEILLPLYKIK